MQRRVWRNKNHTRSMPGSGWRRGKGALFSTLPPLTPKLSLAAKYLFGLAHLGEDRSLPVFNCRAIRPSPPAKPAARGRYRGHRSRNVHDALEQDAAPGKHHRARLQTPNPAGRLCGGPEHEPAEGMDGNFSSETFRKSTGSLSQQAWHRVFLSRRISAVKSPIPQI